MNVYKLEQTSKVIFVKGEIFFILDETDRLLLKVGDVLPDGALIVGKDDSEIRFEQDDQLAFLGELKEEDLQQDTLFEQLSGDETAAETLNIFVDTEEDIDLSPSAGLTADPYYTSVALETVDTASHGSVGTSISDTEALVLIHDVMQTERSRTASLEDPRYSDNSTTELGELLEDHALILSDSALLGSKTPQNIIAVTLTDPAVGSITDTDDGWLFQPSENYNGIVTFMVETQPDNSGQTNYSARLVVTAVDDVTEVLSADQFSAREGKLEQLNQIIIPVTLRDLDSIDPDDPNITVSLVNNGIGEYGQLLQQDGQWFYQVDKSKTLFLSEGEQPSTVTDHVSLLLTDGVTGAVTNHEIAIAIQGIDDHDPSVAFFFSELEHHSQQMFDSDFEDTALAEDGWHAVDLIAPVQSESEAGSETEGSWKLSHKADLQVTIEDQYAVSFLAAPDQYPQLDSYQLTADLSFPQDFERLVNHLEHSGDSAFGMIFGYQDSQNYLAVEWVFELDETDELTVSLQLNQVENGIKTTLTSQEDIGYAGEKVHLTIAVDDRSGIHVSTDSGHYLSAPLAETIALQSFGPYSSKTGAKPHFDNIELTETDFYSYQFTATIDQNVSQVQLEALPEGAWLEYKGELLDLSKFASAETSGSGDTPGYTIPVELLNDLVMVSLQPVPVADAPTLTAVIGEGVATTQAAIKVQGLKGQLWLDDDLSQPAAAEFYASKLDYTNPAEGAVFSFLELDAYSVAATEDAVDSIAVGADVAAVQLSGFIYLERGQWVFSSSADGDNFSVGITGAEVLSPGFFNIELAGYYPITLISHIGQSDLPLQILGSHNGGEMTILGSQEFGSQEFGSQSGTGLSGQLLQSVALETDAFFVATDSAGNGFYTLPELAGYEVLGVDESQDNIIIPTVGATAPQYISTGSGSDVVGTGDLHDIIDLGDSSGELDTLLIGQHELMTLQSYAELDAFGANRHDYSGNSQAGNMGIDRITDVAHAGGGNDHVSGGAGSDVIYGGADSDQLLGGSENDGLRGGLGDDILIGGSGNDLLIGDDGADRFVWQQKDAGAVDTITDFDRSEGDVIDLADLLDNPSNDELDLHLELSLDDKGQAELSIDIDGRTETTADRQTIVFQNTDFGLSADNSETNARILNELMLEGSIAINSY